MGDSGVAVGLTSTYGREKGGLKTLHFQTNHLASGGKRLIQQTLGAHILFQQFSTMQSHVCIVSVSRQKLKGHGVSKQTWRIRQSSVKA